MSWISSTGGRPGKGFRRGVRKRKARKRRAEENSFQLEQARISREVAQRRRDAQAESEREVRDRRRMPLGGLFYS